MRYAVLLFLILSVFAQEPRTVEQADQQDLQQLQAQQQKVQEQLKSMNQLNPLSADMGGKIDPEALPDKLKWIKPYLPYLTDPRVIAFRNRMLNMAGDPEFQRTAFSLAANPNRKWLFAGMILLFIVYALVKRRVLGATDRWWMRLFLRLGLVCVFFLMQFLISYAVLGQPFLELLWHMRKVVA